MSSSLQNQILESHFDTRAHSHSVMASQAVHEVVRDQNLHEVYMEDDGWFLTLISWTKLVICFMTMMVTSFVWVLIMLVLLPWPYERVKQGNVYGHVTGRLVMWILGNSVTIYGQEYSNKRAIYISNHVSIIEAFLIIWLTPTGTIGIAGKEIIHYPLFGQLYILSSHIVIDHSNSISAIESLKEAALRVVKNNLSLMIFPEGRRSEDGRLLPFKKGFVHLALQTKLPIVPIVITGAHNAWRKGTLRVRPTPLLVKFLPPIETGNWSKDKITEHVNLVHNVFVLHLPESQKPLNSPIASNKES